MLQRVGMGGQSSAGALQAIDQLVQARQARGYGLQLSRATRHCGQGLVQTSLLEVLLDVCDRESGLQQVLDIACPDRVARVVDAVAVVAAGRRQQPLPCCS